MNQQIITITQVRSAIDSTQSQRRTLRALGLRRIDQSVQRQNSPVIAGMVRKIAHLVIVKTQAQARQ